jgi:hypothetical protein
MATDSGECVDDYGDDDDSDGAMHEVLRSDYDLGVCRQTSKQPRHRKSDQI